MKATADGSNEAVRKAASDANAIQDAVNLTAIVGTLHRHLLDLRDKAKTYGDDLNNHPVVLAFVGKLNSLTRMNLDRESAAYDAIAKLAAGESVEYDVIPL